MSQQAAFKAKNKPRDIQMDALKMPPHSLEAEQSVLGGLMLDPDAWGQGDGNGCGRRLLLSFSSDDL